MTADDLRHARPDVLEVVTDENGPAYISAAIFAPSGEVLAASDLHPISYSRYPGCEPEESPAYDDALADAVDEAEGRLIETLLRRGYDHEAARDIIDLIGRGDMPISR